MSSLEKKFLDVIKYHVDCALKLKRLDEEKIIKQFYMLEQTVIQNSIGLQRVYDKFLELEQLYKTPQIKQLLAVLQAMRPIISEPVTDENCES